MAEKGTDVMNMASTIVHFRSLTILYTSLTHTHKKLSYRMSIYLLLYMGM